MIENQCHAIAGRDLEQLILTFRFAKFIRRLDDLIQFLNGGALIVARHPGISHDVDEKDVRNFERDLLFYFSRHLLARIVANPSLTSSNPWCCIVLPSPPDRPIHLAHADLVRPVFDTEHLASETMPPLTYANYLDLEKLLT